MKRKTLSKFLLLLWLLPSVAWGLSYEVCGDGVDNDSSHTQPCPAGYVNALNSNGCDLLCPPGDADRDGYRSITGGGFDCDDEDKLIYPGILTTKGCSGGQMRTCQANGTYTSCASWSCPATGSGVCKYFSPTGNDSTGDGSIGNPWKSIAKISNWNTSAPWSLYVPQAGDRFIFRGGTYTDIDYDMNFSNVYSETFNCQNRPGTSTDRIHIMNYPGELPVFDLTSSDQTLADGGEDVFLENCDYWTVEGIHFKSGFGGGVNVNNRSDNVLVRNVMVSDDNGVEDDNLRGIEVHASYNVVLQSVLVWNVWQKTGDPGVVLNNRQISTYRAQNLTLQGVTLYMPNPPSGNESANCFGQKHADFDSSTTVRSSVFYNCVIGNEYAGGNLTVTNNFYGNVNSGLRVANIGGTSYQVGNMLFEYNTFFNTPVGDYLPQKEYNIDGSTAADDCSGNTTPGNFIFRYNNVYDDAVSYNGDSRAFLVRTYGPDALYTAFTPLLDFHHNCYFFVSASNPFGLFESNNGNTTCGGRGVLGQSYTWAQWVASGRDANSFNENPIYDVYHRGTANNCDDSGWLLLSQEVSGGGGSPATQNHTFGAGNARRVNRNLLQY